MKRRSQQTIARAVEVCGIGFLWGADICLRLLPAEPDSGIVFIRSDRLGAPEIPALAEFTVPRRRRTTIKAGGACVEMVEHVMAALAGLHVDNCRVEVDGPEPPGCDGSAMFFAEAICKAGVVQQDRPRDVLVIENNVQVADEEAGSSIVATRAPSSALFVTYELDYGPSSPIRPQFLTVEITPDTFLQQLADARTFLLEAEAHALQAQGYGKRLTPRDLLVFADEGPIDNKLRVNDECVRHKVLDCVGDLALIGCDVRGHVTCRRSGHRLNVQIVNRLKLAHAGHFTPAGCRHAA